MVAPDLGRLTTDDGVFAILAIDHRDSLRVLLNPNDPGAVSPSELTDFKRDVIEGAVGAASAVMLEPEFSIPQLVGLIPDGTGFLAALEAQGYGGNPYARTTTLLDGWSVAQAAEAGAAAAKLLLLYTPDAPEAAARQDELVVSVVEDCARHGLPLFLEPLAYPASPDTPTGIPGERRRMVVEMARRLTELGPTVLKMQFPAEVGVDLENTWAEACEQLDSVVTVPWALLSLGASYDVFRRQLETACAAGCSGFMVGRAAWGELVTAPRHHRRRLAEELVTPRLAELTATATEYGRPVGT